MLAFVITVAILRPCEYIFLFMSRQIVFSIFSESFFFLCHFSKEKKRKPFFVFPPERPGVKNTNVYIEPSHAPKVIDYFHFDFNVRLPRKYNVPRLG